MPNKGWLVCVPPGAKQRVACTAAEVAVEMVANWRARGGRVGTAFVLAVWKAARVGAGGGEMRGDGLALASVDNLGAVPMQIVAATLQSGWVKGGRCEGRKV
eukprot:349585-Chlamydomonas_euryale.AAC.2